MPRKAVFVCALSLILILSACSDKPTIQAPVGLHQSLEVQEGETISINEHLSLKFTRVMGDSRCPDEPTVYCLWPGIAYAEFQLLPSGCDPITVTASIMGFVMADDSAQHLPVRVGDYTITLQQLDPYPTTQMPPSIEPTATVLVEGPITDEPTVPPVRISDLPPSEIQIAPFVLDSLAILADTLNLRIFYGGGCEEHYYFLYMSPAAFMESYPVQANIYLRHIDNDDMCEAWIGVDLKFNLRPIAELYQISYGGLDPIQLNVHEYTGSDSARVVSVIYNPTE